MKTNKTNRITLTLFALALLAGTTSCVDDFFVEGNGSYQTETRMASGFNEVYSGGDFNVTVLPGEEYSVEVSAESNLLSYIETDVVGNRLKVRTRGMYSLIEHRPIEVFVTMPELKALSQSGSGKIKTGAFDNTGESFHLNVSGSGDIDTKIIADQVDAQVSGSGTIYLQGDTDETNFAISGSGKIKAFDLAQENCVATISGSGDMFVNVSNTINAKISGSGRVYYINHPAIHTSISGSGRVIDKN